MTRERSVEFDGLWELGLELVGCEGCVVLLVGGELSVDGVDEFDVEVVGPAVVCCGVVAVDSLDVLGGGAAFAS